MKNMLSRTTIREIKQSFGRFFAIFAIIALGVGFFSGVRITTPAMVHTVDNFMQEHQFYDYRLISSLGWEEEDVEAFKEQDGVRYAEGAYTIDVLYHSENDEEIVAKTHSLPENINGIELVDGRLPEKDNECVVDAVMNNIPEIGEHIYVQDSNEEDTLDMIRVNELTVVGYVDSSYYVNFERGTTSIGTGTVDGFIYVTKDFFDSDAYTEIFVRFDEDYEIYSKQYKDYMADKKKAWEGIVEVQADERYTRLIDEANDELADGEKELADKKKDGEKELADAKKELEDGERELSDAKNELSNARNKLSDAKSKIDENKTKLTDAEKKLDKAKKELDKAKKELSGAKKKLDTSKAQLDAGQAQIDAGQAQLDEASRTVEANEAALVAQEKAFAEKEAEYNAQAEAVKDMWDMLPDEQKETFNKAKEEIAAGKAALVGARTQIEAAKTEIANNQAELNVQKKTLADGIKEYDKGLAQYNAGVKKYEKGKKEYEKGLREYKDGSKKISDGEKEYNTGYSKYLNGLAEYEDGLAEYEDGLAEYEDGVKEFDEKIAEAEGKISDAKKEIADIEEPDTYLLERNTNIGYACFENDSAIVAQVVKVFPIFFVLVAALVCITTMGRMVEEQRTQIGVFKALGYSEGAIMGKFLFYSGSAAVLGCVVGYSIGIILFPKVIWTSYQLMYHEMPIKCIIDWKLAGLSMGASLLCSIGTTWITCRYELMETAAQLMRPKAPKAGKRVFLEYIPVIWNHLKFLRKVSIRNLFRYKGRFFMMIVGIGGCTALLLTGFGIKDSIADFASMQYDEILVADASMTYKTKNDSAKELSDGLKEELNDAAKEYLLLHEASWDLLAGEKVKEISLVVPHDYEDIDNYMNFHTTEGEPLEAPKKGEAFVCQSLAERYNISVGDEVVLRDEDMRQIRVKVTGIFENHVYNYVFLSPDTMESQLNEKLEYNSAYINFPEDVDIYQQSAEIARDEDVTSVTLFADVKERMANMMSSLNYIVFVVIASAAGLAFIVLYNLTNINITERIREIATIKVLGFFRQETSSYVFSENVALTLFGVLFGLVLGILLHRYVMAQIVVDMVCFRPQILPKSFAFSVVLTFIFTLFVNAVMSVKLEKINMAESLKSVE